jgi:MarR family transcriptional regulator, organic hydroperoxide resistance regulator
MSTAPDPDETLAGAARIAAHLQAVRDALRASISSAARSYPVPLTAPQLLALQILVEDLRETGAGLSLSELSKRMGLAHSTTSGIVARLERRELVQRTAQPEDRRFVRIELTQPVKSWVRNQLPDSRLQPLATALSKATPSERTAILDGLATLERLLGD